jgi:hypothetical protein
MLLISGCNDSDSKTTTTTVVPATPSQQPATTTTTESTQNQEIEQALKTSLHGTTRGMKYFYSATQGGFEQFTNVPYEQLTCKAGCHVEPIAAGDCTVCHQQPGDTPTNQACLNCHRRQGMEQAMVAADHHLTAGIKCADCHSAEQIHGDGKEYNSLHEVPQKVNCQQSGCHTTLATKTMHSTHEKNVNCAACHVKATPTCYNCHFPSKTPEDFVTPPVANWKFLVKSKETGKITSGNIMPLTTPQGHSFFVIAPYFSHTIQKESGTTCSSCHSSDALREYKEKGTITLTNWDETTKKLSNISGVIPVPLDWQTALRMDFLIRDANGQWTHQSKVADSSHMLYADPIDVGNMPKF